MKIKDYNEKINDLVVDLHVGKAGDVLTKYLICLGLYLVCASLIATLAVEQYSATVWQLIGFSSVLMTVIAATIRFVGRLFDNIFYGINVGLFLYAVVVAFTITNSGALISILNLIIVSLYAGLYIFSRELVYTIINYKS